MLALPAEVTQTQALALTQALQTQLKAAGPTVQVDASALTRFDSSALAVLLQLRRDALTQGRSFTVTGLPHQLHGLAGLYGVADLLTESA